MKRPTSVQADGTDFWMNSHGVLTAAADSVLCMRLAEAVRGALDASAGDSIDRGLALLAELKKQGFGVIYLGEPERNAGVTECPHGVPHCWPCEQCDAVGAFAAPAPEVWQPIETVPKDGREVILREGSRVGAACWVKWPDTYDYDGAPNADGGEGWTVGYDGDEWNAPDAWQPLPAAAGVEGRTE